MALKNIHKFRWLLLLLNLLFFALLIILMSTRTAGQPFKPKEPLPLYGEVVDFSLTERSGLAFTKENMKGDVWVADFIFTRCAGQCPIMTQQMKRLNQNIEGVRFVSFSVDPEYDSPNVLAGYAKSYGADPQKWIFLTGEREVLNQLTQSFHMSKIDEPMMHSASFVLIDDIGRIRGYYDSTNDENLKKLKHDARILVKQK